MMKKRILAMIVIFVVSLSTIVIADTGLDLSSMSLDELISLRDEVNAEITTRVNPVDGEIIGAGTFIVGKDIKEGIFNLTVKTDGICAIKLYEDRAKFDEGETFLWENPDDGEIVTVNLHNDMVLEISNFSAVIEEQVKPSWAP